MATPAVLPPGTSGFQLRGGGGGSIEPPKTGGFREKGSINKTMSTLFLNSGAKGAKNFLSIENSQIFSPQNPWHLMSFLNPLDALIPKSHFHFSPNSGSESPPGPKSQSR